MYHQAHCYAWLCVAMTVSLLVAPWQPGFCLVKHLIVKLCDMRLKPEVCMLACGMRLKPEVCMLACT